MVKIITTVGKSLVSCVAILLSMSFLSTPSAVAAIVDIGTSLGNGADTYISTWPRERDQNFGSGEVLYLKNDWGTGFVNRKAYMRFDLSTAAGSVTDASLTMSFYEDTDARGGNRAFNVYGLLDGHAGENWGESSTTWDNAPANNTRSATGLIGGQYVPLGSFQFNSAGATQGDQATFSSQALIEFLQDDTNDLATLIFIRQDRTMTNIGFASKENPTLVEPTLTVNTVPIPGALLLLGSGLAGLAGVRSWRKKSYQK